MLALISILYGALLAIGQNDIMRLIAYTSLSHFGFIVLGIFAFTTQGSAGSILYMVNHGLATAALFLVAGFLITRARHDADQRTTAAWRRSRRSWPGSSWSPGSPAARPARPVAVRLASSWC